MGQAAASSLQLFSGFNANKTSEIKNNLKKYSSFKSTNLKDSNLKGNRFKNLTKTNTKPIGNSDSQSENTKGIVVGSKVKHSRFGKGEVLAIEGSFPNIKAMIDFDVNGKKQLLLKFANLELLSD